MDKNDVRTYGKWALINYQPSSTNCGTCDRSSSFDDKNNMGDCNLMVGKTFSIFRHGICRYHSEFKRNLI